MPTLLACATVPTKNSLSHRPGETWIRNWCPNSSTSWCQSAISVPSPRRVLGHLAHPGGMDPDPLAVVVFLARDDASDFGAVATASPGLHDGTLTSLLFQSRTTSAALFARFL